MATARDLITRALKACRILAPSESPSASEANDAFMLLNMMLSSWSTDNLFVYTETLESFHLMGNVGTYTIGTGQMFNTIRPITIKAMYVRSGTIDYNLEYINNVDYADEIAIKSTPGIPYYYNFDNNYPSASINLYPIPSQNYVLYILSEKPLSPLSSLDAVVTFPDGWELAIVYNLAMMLYPEYQQSIDPYIAKMAGDAKLNISRSVNRNRVYSYGNKSENGYRGTDNIFGGWLR